MLKNLDFTASFALIVLPITLIILGIFYIIDHQIGLFEILLFVTGYYISNITVGIGLHRLWSHDSYKTNKYVEFILSLLAAGTLQGPILSWASNHFKHHSFTDTEKDPHNSRKYDNVAKSFFWSHMGWMLVGEGSYKSIDRLTMVKLGKNKILRWQLKYYWQLSIIMNSIVPALVGYICGGTLLSAYAGFLFIGLGRALQQQITFFVNSLCHFAGTKKYTKCTSGDVWWLAFLLLGENWHNFHHAFPSDYRNGAKWYQMDVHKWIIYAMSVCGLAWDLKKTPQMRIKAKSSQTTEQYAKIRKQELELMQIKVQKLTSLYKDNLLKIENFSFDIKKQLQKSFVKIQDNLNNINIQLQQQLMNFDKSSDNITKVIGKKLKKYDDYVSKLHERIKEIQISVV